MARSSTRQKVAGTGRRIKRYVALLESGAAIPNEERPGDMTLAEWIRQCKRAGLFAEGKLLYECGGLRLDRLSVEAGVDVDEDYLTCVRALARGRAGEAGTPGEGRVARRPSYGLD